MPVETECYFVRKKGDILAESYTTYPGSCESIAFLSSKRGKKSKIDLMVICNVDNTEGTILIKGHSLRDKIVALRYGNEDDNIGKRVNVKQPVKIVYPQELSLLSKRGGKKELFFFLSSEEGNSNELENDPQGTLLTV